MFSRPSVVGKTLKIVRRVPSGAASDAVAKLLVEKYLIEIAKIFNVEYEPDPLVMKDDKLNPGDSILIDLSDRNNLDGGGSGGGSSGGGGGGGGGGGAPAPMGFIGYPQPPALPQLPSVPPTIPFQYPQGPSGQHFGSASAPPFNYNIPPNPFGPPADEVKDLNINSHFLHKEKKTLGDSGPPPSYASLSPDDNMQNSTKPKPQPRSKISPDMNILAMPNVPAELPEEPNDDSPPGRSGAGGAGPDDNDEIDFDELSRRFEELKKKK